MDNEIAKEVAGHLSGVKRQLTAIKWLIAVIAVATLTLVWFVAHLVE